MSNGITPRLFEAVGRIALAWAHIEFALDAMYAVATHFDPSLVKSKSSQGVNEKRKALLKAFFRVDQLKPHYLAFVQLNARIVEQIETRHDLIHGVVVAWPAPETLEMMRLLRKDNGIGKITVTTETANAAVGRAEVLMNEALMLAQKVVRCLPNVHDPKFRR